MFNIYFKEMKKFFSLIALVGVFAACEPENLQTAFTVANATATVNETVVCVAPDFDPSEVTVTYGWSVGTGLSTKSITGNPAIEAGSVTVTAHYRGAEASTTVSFPKIFAFPLFGVISPSRVRMVVDLPAPFGPMKPKNSPSSTERSRPSMPLVFP